MSQECQKSLRKRMRITGAGINELAKDETTRIESKVT